jgi:hypothetical protein
VVVRDELRVDGRERADGHAGRDVARDAADDRASQRRIDEERHAVELDEEARMAEPGEAGGLTPGRRAGEPREVGRDGRDPRAVRRAPAPAGEPIPHHPAQHGREPGRPGAVEVHEPSARAAGLFERVAHATPSEGGAPPSPPSEPTAAPTAPACVNGAIRGAPS